MHQHVELEVVLKSKNNKVLPATVALPGFVQLFAGRNGLLQKLPAEGKRDAQSAHAAAGPARLHSRRPNTEAGI